MSPADPNHPVEPPSGLVPGRRALLGAAAAVAAVAGMGLAWRQQQNASTTVTPPVQALWERQWPTPQGQTVQMQAFKGRPLLLNFWATWCPPCVEELPRINAFYRLHVAEGWQVLGLALDKLLPVQAFLKKLPLDFPVGLAGGVEGIELSRSLGNLTGGLPFSVVIGTNGDVLHRKMGPLTEADLTDFVRLK